MSSRPTPVFPCEERPWRRVDALRAERRGYLPRSEQLLWWEGFGELLTRLVQPVAAPQA